MNVILFVNVRVNKIIKTFYRTNIISAATPILNMFNLFMSSNVTALAEYICKAWERRNTAMYHVYKIFYHTIQAILPMSHNYVNVFFK